LHGFDSKIASSLRILATREDRLRRADRATWIRIGVIGITGRMPVAQFFENVSQDANDSRERFHDAPSIVPQRQAILHSPVSEPS